MTFGERIRDLRKQRGMTQEDIGKILGIQRAGVQKYENDTVSNISTSVVDKLAEAFEVSPSYLIGWSSREATLSKEVKMFQTATELYGKHVTEIIHIYSTLNEVGQRKILDYAYDLSEIRQYKVQDN